MRLLLFKDFLCGAYVGGRPSDSVWVWEEEAG